MAESTEYQTQSLDTATRFEIRPAVFVPAVVIIVAFVILGVAFTDTLQQVFTAVQEFIAATLGWFYILTVTGFLLFVICLAASRHGRKRLGPDDSRPDYSYWSWFAMLFSAGMGIGLLFFSVAEPISHFALEVPPYVSAEAGSEQAAQEAMNVTFFHWGLHAWAIYVIVGLALGYFAYRRGLPLTMRSAFYPLLGDRIQRWPGDAIDTLAIVGTLFGVATSLGLGAIQINAGLGAIADVGSGNGVQLIIIAAITAVATGSVVLGLDKGIRRLSLLNIIMGAALTAFILFAGPTAFLLDAFVRNVGTYVQNLPTTSLETAVFSDGGWQTNWTLFYWGWWISWSPFVGMFIARISRGRTLREFITGVLLVPTLVTFVVLTIFGQTAIHSELFGAGGIAAVAEENIDVALFETLGQLPLAAITSVVAIVVIATFFITSSDSGSLVDDIHASGGSLNPKIPTRVFWALCEGFVAAVLLIAGGQTGLEALQQASVATGVPLAILLIFICVALTRALQSEELAPAAPAAGSPERERAEPDGNGDGARSPRAPEHTAGPRHRRT